ncbi:MAG: ppaX [Nocardioides sp.]|nr:ppaX [Nocardioides sp.]
MTTGKDELAPWDGAARSPHGEEYAPKEPIAPREPGTFSAVAFDLDGTLVDTLPAMEAGFNEMLSPLVGRSISREEIVSRLGPSLVDIMRIYDPETPEQRAATYLERSIQLHLDHARLYPGIRELLEELRNRGYRMAVVTSKRRKTAIPTLEALGIADFFVTVVAEDDVTRMKPDPEPVEMTAAALGVDPSDLLVVGDNPTDMYAAHAAGSAAAAAAWGYYGDESGKYAHWVLRHPADVLDYLEVVGTHDTNGNSPL